MESVRAVMNHNQQKKIGFPELKDKISDEMYENVKFYANFHVSSVKVSNRQLLKDAEEFFNDGRNYVMNAVDVCIAATANAIKHNLYIFENLGGQAVIIQQSCREETTDGIFLKYTHILKGNHVSDHYDATVDLELPQHLVCAKSSEMNQLHNEDDIEADYGEMYDGDMNEEFDKENTKHPRSQDSPIPSRNQDSPIPSRNQDSPIPSTTQYSPMPIPRKKIKYQRNGLNLAKFENYQIEVVEKMPWEVDGTKVFKIYCSEEHWYDAQKDLRHWVFTNSSRVGLPGVRKFGNCQGNFICRNDECLKFTSEHVSNEIDFTKEKLVGTHAIAVVTVCNERDAVQRKSENSTVKMKNSLFTMKATTIVFLKSTLMKQ